MTRQTRSEGRAPSQRQLRVGEVIRHALSEALVHGDLHDPDLEGLSITVGEVRTSPDLRVATAYVLPLGGGDTEIVVEALERNRGQLRKIVNRAVSLKFSPELRFQPDRSYDQMDRTRELLNDPRVRRDLDED